MDHNILALQLARAQRSNDYVIDVSNIDDNGNGYRKLQRSANPRSKFSVHGLPEIVSNNQEHYNMAMDLLGDDFEKYKFEYAKLIQSKSPNTKKSVERISPNGYMSLSSPGKRRAPVTVSKVSRVGKISPKKSSLNTNTKKLSTQPHKPITIKPQTTIRENNSDWKDDKKQSESSSPKKETLRSFSPKKETLRSFSPKKETLRSVSPKKETLRSVSPKKETLRSVSPKKETLRSSSPKKETSRSSSPKKETSRSVSPKKEASRNVSPKKETSRSVSPKKEISRRISPKKETLRSVSPKKEASRSSSPKKETSRSVSPKKEISRSVSPKKDTLRNVSPKKETSRSVSPKKETLKSVNPKKETSRSVSPKKETLNMTLRTSSPKKETSKTINNDKKTANTKKNSIDTKNDTITNGDIMGDMGYGRNKPSNRDDIKKRVNKTKDHISKIKTNMLNSSHIDNIDTNINGYKDTTIDEAKLNEQVDNESPSNIIKQIIRSPRSISSEDSEPEVGIKRQPRPRSSSVTTQTTPKLPENRVEEPQIKFTPVGKRRSNSQGSINRSPSKVARDSQGRLIL